MCPRPTKSIQHQSHSGHANHNDNLKTDGRPTAPHTERIKKSKVSQVNQLKIDWSTYFYWLLLLLPICPSTSTDTLKKVLQTDLNALIVVDEDLATLGREFQTRVPRTENERFIRTVLCVGIIILFVRDDFANWSCSKMYCGCWLDMTFFRKTAAR